MYVVFPSPQSMNYTHVVVLHASLTEVVSFFHKKCIYKYAVQYNINESQISYIVHESKTIKYSLGWYVPRKQDNKIQFEMVRTRKQDNKIHIVMMHTYKKGN